MRDIANGISETFQNFNDYLYQSRSCRLTNGGINHDIVLSPRMDVFLRGYPIPGYASQLYRSDGRFDQVSKCYQFLRH